MKPLNALAAALLCLSATVPALAQDVQSVQCGSCAEWNQPQKPFNIYGNSWYVGTAGLSAVLVTGPKGHVLLDGDLPQSAPQIQKNIESLGFKIQDVKLILNSHAHFDHSGGIAALQRASGAVVVASAAGKREIMAGTNTEDDPQFDPDDRTYVSKPKDVKVVADGETLSLGPLKVTAHLTPGHTPGSTTWTWKSCEKGVCRDIVYADSLTMISTDGFHFTGDARHPDISRSALASIEKVGNLPCDVIISTHPGATGTFDKLARRTAAVNPFIDKNGCKAYADHARRAFERRIEQEKAEKAAATAHG
jgi:metallo-beta-lactamase class B